MSVDTPNCKPDTQRSEGLHRPAQWPRKTEARKMGVMGAGGMVSSSWHAVGRLALPNSRRCS